MKKNKAFSFFLNLIAGALIGGGGILPGISGGVLCLLFGIYAPLMELFSHPKQAISKYFSLLLPVGLGALAGFWGFAKLIVRIFAANEILATWLFLGLIAGMFPALFRDSGKQGRSPACLWSFLFGFALLFGTLLVVRLDLLPTVQPGFAAFVFCGVLWGLSIVVPGMTSSSQLMALGLFQPLSVGISNADPAVLIPWLLGIVVTVLACARLVHRLFQRHYAVLYHGIMGFALSSTLMVVPLHYASGRELFLSLLCGVLGFALAWAMDKLELRTRRTDSSHPDSED